MNKKWNKKWNKNVIKKSWFAGYKMLETTYKW